MHKIRQMMDFIDNSPTAYQALDEAVALLEGAGFLALDKEEFWELEEGGRYYLSNQGGALVAFDIGSLAEEDLHFRIIGSHGDSPGFKIKPSPEIRDSLGQVSLNTEVYGGPIMSTWFDRPLSLAGRVMTREGEGIRAHLVNIDRDLMTIPNLAIHMNREVNSGYKFNPQKDTLPFLGIDLEGEVVLDILAKELGSRPEDILDFDLFLYVREEARLLGLEEEFLSAGRLDNLAMAYLSLEALINTRASSSINMVVIYDNEEVGSQSRVGAGGPFLREVLERIASLSGADQAYFRAMSRSFMVSADMTHARHPNYPDKADPTNAPLLNGGPALKQAASKAYASDAFSGAVFRLLCQEAGVPLQTFTNRSDIRGGSTIGPISLGQVDIAMADIGNPLLAMHSSRELVGVKDQEALAQVFRHFYTRDKRVSYK